VSLALPPGLTTGVCAALGVSRASVHRRRIRLIAPPPIRRVRSRPTRALSGSQQREVFGFASRAMFRGSESHFKTLKCQPRFPQRFESIEHARNFCRRFFEWYNQDHHNAGIGLMTPDQVHFGRVDGVHARPGRSRSTARSQRTPRGS
jgi:hypothetical protein